VPIEYAVDSEHELLNISYLGPVTKQEIVEHRRELEGDPRAVLRYDTIVDLRFGSIALSADEIRAIREQFGLTQSELARLLHLGANTISRWESGRNVQTEAMEMLLRLLRDLPGSLAYLRRHAA
jgi:putative zinc finger/helix-turn-helix YgiT family protein